MKLDKPANKVVMTSVLTASALGMAVPSTLMEKQPMQNLR